MNSFFDQLEAQLQTAAHAQTASSWERLRARPGWLRTGARTVPILAGLAVTVAVVVVALMIGSHAHRVTGSHKSPTTNTTTAQPSSTPAPSSLPSPLSSSIRNRLITSSDLPTFAFVDATDFSSVREWLAAERAATPNAKAAEKAMLTHNGFRAGAREDLINGGTPGVSIVEQFRSSQAARAAMAFYDAQFKAGGGNESFSVPGIPRAQGLTDVTNHGVNVAFTDGPYYYQVGQGGGGAAAIAAMKSAALHLYHRVHS